MCFLKINFKKLQTFHSSVFIGQNYFFNDGAQLYLIFQTLYYTLKRLSDAEKLYHGNLKDCQPKKKKKNTIPITTDNSLSPSINWYEDLNCCLSFKGSCLKHQKRNFYSS